MKFKIKELNRAITSTSVETSDRNEPEDAGRSICIFWWADPVFRNQCFGMSDLELT